MSFAPGWRGTDVIAREEALKRGEGKLDLRKLQKQIDIVISNITTESIDDFYKSQDNKKKDR